MIIIKKILTLILCILLLTLTGCDIETSNIVPPKVENQFRELVIDGLKYDSSSNTISYNIENKGAQTIYTGMAYYIEKYDENNGWIKTNLTDDLVFIEIAIVIDPDKNFSDKIDVSKLENSGDGYYRIVKEFTMEEKRILQYIEIEVKDNKITSMQSYNKCNN